MIPPSCDTRGDDRSRPLPEVCVCLLGAVILCLALTGPTVMGPRSSYAEAPVDLSTDSDAYRTARRNLPDRFVAFETGHYVVLSDAGSSWTTDQGELLERAFHQFHRFCGRMGLSPAPLRHKLVAVAFEDRADYRQFAHVFDQVENPDLSGYYSPRDDRVVFYNVETNPSVTEARSKLDQMQAEIRLLDARVHQAARSGQTDEAQALRDMHAQYRRHVALQRDRIDAFSSQTSIATNVHEAVHQLMFHTGLQSAQVRYPLWISEGLATAFETDAPRGAFGPDHVYPPRREQFEELLDEQSLLPLRSLLTIVDLQSAGTDLTRVVYHQSYALVTWMSRFRQTELRCYLEAMRQEPAGPVDPDRTLDLFEACFGDIGQLERAWLAAER